MTIPKLPPPPRKAPEQVRVFGCACLQQSAVRRHDFGRDQIVASQPMFAAELAEPTPERQSGYAGIGVDAHGRRKTMRLSGRIELS